MTMGRADRAVLTGQSCTNVADTYDYGQSCSNVADTYDYGQSCSNVADTYSMTMGRAVLT